MKVSDTMKQMLKALEAENVKIYKDMDKMVIKMNIKVSKPITYAPITIDFETMPYCDHDRGAWRNKTYHVVFEGRGAEQSLCGRQLWRSRLWVAYLEPGSEMKAPYGRRVCKRCAAHPDYILHTLALV